MLWIKAFHIIFIITWFAGLFYLPRLFVYHAMCDDETSNARFKIMERKLYNGIMMPSAVLALATGLWMTHQYAWEIYQDFMWLKIKFVLVFILIIYHFLCNKHRIAFLKNRNQRSHIYFRWFNEFPVLILVSVILLITLKPV